MNEKVQIIIGKTLLSLPIDVAVFDLQKSVSVLFNSYYFVYKHQIKLSRGERILYLTFYWLYLPISKILKKSGTLYWRSNFGKTICIVFKQMTQSVCTFSCIKKWTFKKVLSSFNAWNTSWIFLQNISSER